MDSCVIFSDMIEILWAAVDREVERVVHYRPEWIDSRLLQSAFGNVLGQDTEPDPAFPPDSRAAACRGPEWMWLKLNWCYMKLNTCIQMKLTRQRFIYWSRTFPAVVHLITVVYNVREAVWPPGEGSEGEPPTPLKVTLSTDTQEPAAERWTVKLETSLRGSWHRAIHTVCVWTNKQELTTAV